jgi:hypothetical protein
MASLLNAQRDRTIAFSPSLWPPILHFVPVIHSTSGSRTKFVGFLLRHPPLSQIDYHETLVLTYEPHVARGKHQSRYPSMVYIWGWQMAVLALFHPTSMNSLIKSPPGLNIFSKQGATKSAAGPVKLDFTRCSVSGLYAALKSFEKRFSGISQDVTDPVSPSTSSLSPTPFAVADPQIFIPDSLGSGEVPWHYRRSHLTLDSPSA